MQKVVIGSDHAGFEMKERIKKELSSEYEFVDMGTNSKESVDYPVYVEKVARQVALSPGAKGVVFCGTGIGASIVANKVNGVRAALCSSKRAAELARQHNDANVVALAGRDGVDEDPVGIVRTFLSTPFSGDPRHARRIQEMMDVEKHN